MENSVPLSYNTHWSVRTPRLHHSMPNNGKLITITPLRLNSLRSFTEVTMEWGKHRRANISSKTQQQLKPIFNNLLKFCIYIPLYRSVYYLFFVASVVLHILLTVRIHARAYLPLLFEDSVYLQGAEKQSEKMRDLHSNKRNTHQSKFRLPCPNISIIHKKKQPKNEVLLSHPFEYLLSCLVCFFLSLFTTIALRFILEKHLNSLLRIDLWENIKFFTSKAKCEHLATQLCHSYCTKTHRQQRRKCFYALTVFFNAFVYSF